MLLFRTLVCIALGALCVCAASPPVTVSLASSFMASDPLLEALETLAMEDSKVLFPLLSSFPLKKCLSTPRDTHQAVFDLASAYLDAPTLASAWVRMGLHASTPRLAAFAQHYDGHVANLPDSSRLSRGECASWVDWYGQVVCDSDSLLHLANSVLAETQADAASKAGRLPFDHVYSLQPLLLDEPRYTAIHYADPTASSFAALHTVLLALEPKVEYVLRWARSTSNLDTGDLSSYLSGYGVALDLKKMDYLVLDDRNRQRGGSSQGSLEDDLPSGSLESGNRPEEAALSCIFESLPYTNEQAEARAEAAEPLSTEEIADLGLKAVQLLTSFSNESFPNVNGCWETHVQAPSVGDILRLLSTSFPLYAVPLARKVDVSVELKDEVHENWAKAAPGSHMVWVNGRVLKENQGSSGNMFGILNTLQRERGIVKSLTALGLTREQAIEFLVHPAHSSTNSKYRTSYHPNSIVQDNESDVRQIQEQPLKSFSIPSQFTGFLDGLFDASDRQEGGDTILWINDLEVDQRYARYNPSLSALLRIPTMALFSPAFHVRWNLINAVFILDLSQLRSFSILSTLYDNWVMRGYPIRWGFVPETEGEGLHMARVLYYVKDKYGRDVMVNFIKNILIRHGQRGLATLSWQIVHEAFDELSPPDDFILVTDPQIATDNAFSEEKLVLQSLKYRKRLGLASREAGSGHVFVNGRHLVLNDNILRLIMAEAQAQLQILQEMVHIGEITEADAPMISTFFYDLSSTMPRRSPYIFASRGSEHSPDGAGVEMFNLAELSSDTGFKLGHGSFVVPAQYYDGVLALTMHVIGDLNSSEGIKLIQEALKFVSTSSDSRITFVHNPMTSAKDDSNELSKLLTSLVSEGSLSDVPPNRLLAVLDNGAESSSKASWSNLLIGKHPDDAKVSDLSRQMRLMVRWLGLECGQLAVLVNGRLVGPFDSGADFLAEDFRILESFEIAQRVGKVMEALDDVLGEVPVLGGSMRSDLIAVASPIVHADQRPDPSEVGRFDTTPRARTQSYRLLSSTYTKYVFGDKSTASIHLGLLLDPLSEPAQKWSSLLTHHSTLFPEVFIELYLNPAQHSEIPLKRFYRYSVPVLQYDTSGMEVPAEVAFTALPEEPIYTLRMDVPESWLVRPREALYDLDNIQLGMLEGQARHRGVQVLFALDYLVVEGHARELRTNEPPRGVQLQLVNAKDHSIVDDTLVVANLGYLQFKVPPGTFRLEIREGRGRSIFELKSVGAAGWNSPSVAEAGEEFTVMSFDGLTLYPQLARRPGMERMDVLREAQPSENVSSGMMDRILFRIRSLFGRKDEDKALVRTGVEPAEINIFTVASGLLYERFASIMILSVLRNTRSTVKFWFIENFLSPSFLEFIPHMAKEYEFQYELVTYKWPSWLRAQKEKQRVIWAYKILFLDVLFPMDLKKVIFVDADQIVRADLKELVDLDLHGAPYGYVPMGDDNHDMEGFRFWKTGYWRDFLDGRPYHISALYVVDLVRFRQMAAGDILRGQYHLLSADPHSLANLDQDLPNNLQRDVPIYSLHEDWLWCETWCSKERLHRAKTIDLCQNPLTKEPKLSRARRIPEWEEYDTEIARFARRLAADGRIHASVATADTNLLAGGGAPKHEGIVGERMDAVKSHDEL